MFMSSDSENPLIALARDRDLDAVESLWMERLEGEAPDLEELFHAARYLVSRHLEEHAGILLWSLITSVAERAAPRAALEVARRAVLMAPTEQNLREELFGLYKQVYAGALRLEQILEDSDLLHAADADAAVRFIEDYLHLQPGAYLVHRMSSSPGRVRGFEDDVYVIESDGAEFRHQPNHIFQWWAPFDASDFRAQLAFQPDVIRRLAEENPEGLMRTLLASYNNTIDFKQLKAALIPGVVAPAEWSKWWSRAKPAIKQSAWIELSGGTQPTLTLRKQAAGYSESFLARFRAARTTAEKTELVLEYLADLRAGAPPGGQLAATIGAELMRRAATAESAEALALLAAASALYTVAPGAPDPAAAIAERVAHVTDPADILARTEKDDLARMILEVIKSAAPQRWPELLAEAFPAASLRTCDWIARELNGAGHEHLFHTAAETAAATPDQAPLAFGWVWRYVLSAGGPLAEKINPVSASAGLLRLIHRLERLPKHAPDRAHSRRVLTKLRALISADNSRRMTTLIAQSSVAEAARLHEAVSSCDGLAGEVRHRLLDAIAGAHPEHFVEKQNIWEDGNIYLAAEGYARLHAALDKILNQDMRQNAMAIGAAAEKGDLRENWEYKSALEERDRLVERATRMRQEFDNARVLSPSDITTEHVTVGVTVRLRDLAAGNERSLTFLGPWDADIEQGVYSYLAPLSLGFMGKKLGDRITADLGAGPAEYEITAIETAV